MEQEFKWNADPALQQAVLLWALDHNADQAKSIQMDARYYDTPNGDLAAEKVALRLRQEDAKRVCCLKLRGDPVRGGLHAHEEFECPASCIVDGLPGLIQQGAPQALCQRLLTLPLAETCRVAFTRYAVQLHIGEAEAELALDRGSLSANGNSAPLCEIELERKGGSERAFLALGGVIAKQFDLHVQMLSKLARARAL